MSLRYQWIIGGIDRTGNVALGATIDRNLGSKDSARFTTISTDGSYTPELGDALLLYDNSYSPADTMFDGKIVSIERTRNNGTTILQTVCQADDHSSIVDDRVVLRFYPLGQYGLLQNIAQGLIDDYMDGYTLDTAGSVNEVIGDMTFPGMYLREALNALCKVAGCTWKINRSKVLKLFRIDSSPYNAPTSISDANENYVSARLGKKASELANRVYVRSTRDLGAVWTDTHNGNGSQTIFPTVYNLTAAPIVFVNDVAQVVVEYSEIVSPPVHDWYWIMGGSGVIQEEGATPLGSDDVLVVQYLSPLPYCGFAESPPSIATYGLFERLMQQQETENKQDLDDLAAAEIERAATPPSEIEIVTREDGFEPGQLVSVDIASPAIIGDYLCESVGSREVSQDFFEATLRLSSANVEKARPRSAPSEYFKEIITQLRLPDTTPKEIITFVLAGTVAGLTNPGLTTGVKEASKVVAIGGIIRAVTLRWKTAPGATVEIDVLQNGSSIFSGDGIQTASGSTAVTTKWEGFTSDPKKLEAGDIITISVTTASSAAKDGTLDVILI